MDKVELLMEIYSHIRAAHHIGEDEAYFVAGENIQDLLDEEIPEEIRTELDAEANRRVNSCDGCDELLDECTC